MPGTRLELVTRGFSVRLQYNHLSIFTVYAYLLPPFYPQSQFDQNLLLLYSSCLDNLGAKNVALRFKMDLNPYAFEVIILEYGVGSFIS